MLAKKVSDDLLVAKPGKQQSLNNILVVCCTYSNTFILRKHAEYLYFLS